MVNGRNLGAVPGPGEPSQEHRQLLERAHSLHWNENVPDIRQCDEPLDSRTVEVHREGAGF